MKITVTFAWGGDPREMPYLAAAYDEYTFDAHGGVPDFYVNDCMKADGDLRECVIEIPDEAVLDLYVPPTIRTSLRATTES